MTEYNLLIGGRLVAGALATPVVNPATGAPFAMAPRASVAQLDAAVSAAKTAFATWSRTPVAARRAALTAIAGAIGAHAEAIALILVQEHGMPLASARIEVMVAAIKLRTAAEAPLGPKTIDVGAGRRVEQHYRPLGVVAVIVPWNLPLILLCAKLGPALLLGNTVVVKPAPTTPLATLMLGEIIASLVPPGVINVIADDNDLGGALTSHPDVRMVSFTGSTATGKKVMAAGVDTLKRFVLELGGNDPSIVLNDVDPVSVAATLFAGAFLNGGQACIAVKRVYAQDAIYDRLCEELGKLAAAAKVGDGFTDGVEFGPMQNKVQFDRVNAILADARAKGVLVASAKVPTGSGYFVAPSIFRDIREGARLVDEEQFGPLLPIIRFSDVDDAIARANATPYGLAASVFCSNEAQGYAIAAQLDAGTVTVNKLIDFDPRIPFAGAKASGMGVENCEEGLAEFGQLQIMDVACA
jgi:acyl-CoA reductase-like NAD-dependent aldehyde dehydrogenase